MLINLRHVRLPHKILVIKGAPKQVKRCAATTTSARSAEAIFIEKTLAHEVPIISVTDTDNVDMIGPPDPVSNLRPIVRKRWLHETELQQRLRLMQDDTQAWNQMFWAEHNTKFTKQRKAYTKSKQAELGEERTLNADEMSEFYKRFLDENWSTHVTYNLEWYKRNFTQLFLALRASLPQSLHFISRSN